MKRSSKGFTLIEVLVALAVLAVALGALITTASGHTRNTAYLTERTLAQWVAANAIASIHLEHRWPALGVLQGRETMGPQTWRWEAVTRGTDDPDLRRVEVAVRVHGDGRGSASPVATLVTYMGRPSGQPRP